ncbi:DNA helicase [Streptomyces phage mu1/6]|uniref:DNA helicase n=1 Tax=Streptomyces phage mu1/6 TaxID=370623 RepID=UPI0000D4F6C3|nr:DNA helicase [Streptomyces phage mu1/6]ABD94186.1 DNA helicase [Streptomyces phage mu1/6]
MSNVHPFPAPPEDEGDYIDRPVPEAQAAEMAVLSACMNNRENVARANFLRSSDFYRPAHELIWNTLQQQYRTDGPTDPIALHHEITKLGQAHRVDGGAYLFTVANTIVGGTVEYYADIVAEQAALRRADALAVRIKTAIASGARPDQITAILAEHTSTEEKRSAEATGAGPTHLLASALDWDVLFGTNYGNVQLLPGQLLAPGQQAALVGDGKAGKSLFAQEWAWRMATGRPFLGDRPQRPIRVTYVDAENGHPELQQRLRSFGAGPDDMGAITYLSFPPVRPLDTPAGGQDLLAIATATRAEVVFIDTISRFITGVENDADTWLGLYRHTLMPLKAAGIASIRLDHMGKDGERGARGSSAKTQDVDHVWTLAAQGGGILSLKRTHSRTGIGPGEFTVLRHSKQVGGDWVFGATRHELMTFADRAALVEGSPEWIAEQLDRANVPAHWGRDRLKSECSRLGIPAATSKLEAVVKIRKTRENLPSDLPSPSQPALDLPAPAPAPDDTISAGQTCPGQVSNTPGQPAPDLPALSPSLKRGQVGQEPAPDTPLCTDCGHPLHPDRAARGYDTHVLCDTTEETTP